MFANATRYAALAVPYTDERGVDVLVVLVKASFVKRDGVLRLRDEQAPIRVQDVPTDESAVAADRASSVRFPSDVTGEKVGADIVVVGDAMSAKPVTQLDVSVRAPERSLTLTVHGERVFYKGALGMKLSPAAAFQATPVTYERAYGGTSKDGVRVDWRNPAGRGVHTSSSELDGAPAPSIEDPRAPITDAGSYEPMGFGAVATWWLPRKSFAGTMDEAWMQERMPLPLLDFDKRFHQVAAAPLQMDRALAAGDVIAARGMSKEPLFEVTVPAVHVVAHLRRAHAAPVTLPLVLDTALLLPNDSVVEFTFRRVVPIGRGDTLVREVRVDVED
jgi:hypothetical protein